MEQNGAISNISSSIKETMTEFVNIGKQGHRKWRRIHGFQFPWHPQQVIAWVLLLYFTLFSFLVIVPAFKEDVHMAFYIVHLIIYLSHFGMHLVSMMLDPADYNLRAKEGNKKKTVPEFDRRQHAHVIENGRCHLCNIIISSPRTKHCSTCNKCVDVFDHHCKWLNQCIGKRNYKWFMGSVVTAILMSLLFVSLSITLICASSAESAEYLLRSSWQKNETLNSNITLLTFQANNLTENISFERNNSSSLASTSSFALFYQEVPEEAFVAMVVISTVIAFIASGLLLHLLVFHVYIKVIGITTYEYVRAHRVAQERQQQLNTERTTATLANQNQDEMGRANKHLSDNSSGSQQQWDKLEREHGPGSKEDERKCFCTCCPSPLPMSFCNKSKSNIHPMPQQPRSSNTNNDKNFNGLKENNKDSTTNHLESKNDNPQRKPSLKYHISVEEKHHGMVNDQNTSAISYSVNTKNVISSSVPKLPSIEKNEDNHRNDLTANNQLDKKQNDVKGNDEVSRKNLELLELNIKSVEDQNHLQNGKRTHNHRTNGVNRYNHMPWNHYHEDQDAIFVVDA